MTMDASMMALVMTGRSIPPPYGRGIGGGIATAPCGSSKSPSPALPQRERGHARFVDAP